MKHLPLAPAYLENQIFSHEPGPPGVVGYAECQGIEEKPVQIDQLMGWTTRWCGPLGGEIRYVNTKTYRGLGSNPLLGGC
ncbi:hypothetical protein VN97_g11027 [Penicillium thymicola]|uniref:Uncharacterized protein n=1 Tax=Penicillium thymicola TaxID=293382 RepID=A0AAI9X3D4_PENTH|nr:hypothetical protein VN97_g11027 [Penicillium thymicola]